MGKTVLLVDDSKDIRASFTGLIEVMGHKVITASNGEEGQSIVESGIYHIDLILSDLEMAPKNGAEFYEAIKDRGIPFILMSSHEDAPIIAKKMGVTFVEKPISAKTLRLILS